MKLDYFESFLQCYKEVNIQIGIKKSRPSKVDVFVKVPAAVRAAGGAGLHHPQHGPRERQLAHQIRRALESHVRPLREYTRTMFTVTRWTEQGTSCSTSGAGRPEI